MARVFMVPPDSWWAVVRALGPGLGGTQCSRTATMFDCPYPRATAFMRKRPPCLNPPVPRLTVTMLATALAATALLSACAADGDADPPVGSTSPTASTSDGPIALDFVIENLQVSPTVNRVAVDIGDEVTLGVTSDEDDTAHVHGVERRLILTGGERGVLDFTIPPGLARGVYTVEMHDTGLILFELRVR